MGRCGQCYPKIKIDTSDPETKAIFETAMRAREEVASWPAWRRGDPMRLRDHAKEILGRGVGCSDGSCIWGPPGGMQTNGGCMCLKDAPGVPELRILLRQMACVAKQLCVYQSPTRPTSRDEDPDAVP
jgi:hypothetical protein